MKRFRRIALLLCAAACGEDDEDLFGPLIVITSPTAALVNGTVTFSALVEDESGVEAVRFEAGTTVIGQDLEAPYEVQWDTTTLTDGEIRLRVVARDLAGNSSAVTRDVTVRNNNDPN